MVTEPSGVGVWSPKIADQALVRKFVSQGGLGYVAISIQNGATSVDPDPDTLALEVWYNDVVTNPSTTNPYGTQMLTVTADSITRDDVGKYHYNIGPELTQNRGLLTEIWTYQVTPARGNRLPSSSPTTSRCWSRCRSTTPSPMRRSRWWNRSPGCSAISTTPPRAART